MPEKKDGLLKPIRSPWKKSVPLGKSKEHSLFQNNSLKNPVGKSFQERRVFFTRKDRENHTHIIGSTGTGKSKFLELLIRQDIKDRKAGLCLLDPHGSLYEEILLYVSHKCPHLSDRFILFHPAGEMEQILGFNPIPSDIEYIDYVLDMLISACLKAWGQDNTDRTPRITRWLENIFYTIIANGLTLVETAPLLNIYSKENREVLLQNVNSAVVLDDWRTFEASTQTQKQTIIEGAANRLRKFLRNEIIRNIIGQKQRALNFREIMDEGSVLLVNLSSAGKISPENAQLLGIMLVNEIFRVAKLRDPRDSKLKPFYFYIDEFGQFITRDIARALEECRKYKLFMILAHQHLAQLKREDEYLYASVLTNCKNKVVFGGLSKEDADIMADEVVTGFVNLKSVKDELYSTKIRYHEETRRVFGKSHSETKGMSWSETDGTSESHGITDGQSVTAGKTITKTEGESATEGRSEGKGKTTTKSETKGVSDGQTTTKGISIGASESETKGSAHSRNKSRSDGTSTYHGDAVSRADGESFSHNNRNTFQYGKSGGDTRAHSSGSGSQQTTSSGSSDTESQSKTKGSNISRSHSEAKSHFDSSSESFSEAESIQHGTQESRSKNSSLGLSEQESHTESRSATKTVGKSQSTTKGESSSTTAGESVSEVPFLRPEEYQELSKREFWTKDELHYMEMAAMKNQATGEAFIKVAANPPVKTKVDYVKPTFYSPRFSPKRIDAFRKKVFLTNQDCYTPVLEARREYEERQRRVFGEPLRFDEKPLLKHDSEVIDIEAEENAVQDPFGE